MQAAEQKLASLQQEQSSVMSGRKRASLGEQYQMDKMLEKNIRLQNEMTTEIKVTVVLASNLSIAGDYTLPPFTVALLLFIHISLSLSIPPLYCYLTPSLIPSLPPLSPFTIFPTVISLPPSLTRFQCRS